MAARRHPMMTSLIRQTSTRHHFKTADFANISTTRADARPAASTKKIAQRLGRKVIDEVHVIEIIPNKALLRLIA